MSQGCERYIEIHTSNLRGEALNWVVASIEKLPADQLELCDGKVIVRRAMLGDTVLRCEFAAGGQQSSELIEREEIDTCCLQSLRAGDGVREWEASITGTAFRARGDTHAVAALRCFVLSRLGALVLIPVELSKAQALAA